MSYLKNSVNTYFDSITYGGFAAVLPSTITIVSIFIVVVNSDLSPLFKEIENKVIPNASKAAFLSSLLAVVLCFWEIVSLQVRQYSMFSYRKSLLNTLIIFIHCSYSLVIFLFLELSKLGNIPVGRN